MCLFTWGYSEGGQRAYLNPNISLVWEFDEVIEAGLREYMIWVRWNIVSYLGDGLEVDATSLMYETDRRAQNPGCLSLCGMKHKRILVHSIKLSQSSHSSNETYTFCNFFIPQSMT